MTSYKIEKLQFQAGAIANWARQDATHANWPVVYTLSGNDQIYIGETANAYSRMLQHLANDQKSHLQAIQIILDKTFNKSVCLDLESHLIRLFAADEKHRVLNGNSGIIDANYFDRDRYRASFNEIFEEMVADGVLGKPVSEIINSNLFKYSPFKALNHEQENSVREILNVVFDNLKSEGTSQIVVQGDPGTGKTIVAVYLLKLLRDIGTSPYEELALRDSAFSHFFSEEFHVLAHEMQIGLVIPQQALRKTLKDVFKRTPGLNKNMVMSPFEVGESAIEFDLLIVDESHRLGQRANQSSASLNKKFHEINLKLFGEDSDEKTQLDWVAKKSKNQLLLLDTAQRIKPGDLPTERLRSITAQAQDSKTWFSLSSQMRVQGGADYIHFVDRLLRGERPEIGDFGTYDFRFFDNFAEMRNAILRKDQEEGLSRLVAGFAWEWKSKNCSTCFDIEIDGEQMQWNRQVVDWVNSDGSVNEMGSIHTIQGYDLNYAGVVIGKDLYFDPIESRIKFSRANYFDTKGKENNARLGITYTDEELLEFVQNIYKVLMTRGIKGTYVYVVDDALRVHLTRQVS